MYPRAMATTTTVSCSPPAAASPESPASSANKQHLSQRLDLGAIHALISSVDRHVQRFLADDAARAALQARCSARLAAAKRRGHFEFAEHSVVSNLYWGVQNVEAAVRTAEPSAEQQRRARLVASERMLQIPAMLEEEGATAGLPNRYLVCCSYFYLALVRRLQGDEWQMAMHLLQAVIVSPRYVRTELAPGLCGNLFLSRIPGGGCEDAVDEATGQLARRYKDWLMYYRVVSYGEKPLRSEGRAVEADAPAAATFRDPRSYQQYQYRNCVSTGFSIPIEQEVFWPIFDKGKVHHRWYTSEDEDGESNIAAQVSVSNVITNDNYIAAADGRNLFIKLDYSVYNENKEYFDIKHLQEMLEDSQSETSVSFYSRVDSTEGSDTEVRMYNQGNPLEVVSANTNLMSASRNIPGESSGLPPESARTGPRERREASRCPMHMESTGLKTGCLASNNSLGSVSDLSLSVLDVRDAVTFPSYKCYLEYSTPPSSSPPREFRCFSHFQSKLLRRYCFPELAQRGSFARKKLYFSNGEKDLTNGQSKYENEYRVEFLGKFEKAISTLWFSEGLGKCEDAGIEVTSVWEMITSKPEIKYGTLKQEILHQLLDIISTSKEEKVVRTSVYILLVLASEDKSVVDDIKRKESHLYCLARALKTNIQEAVILIYLVEPSPSEIRDLELLPALLEVACNPCSSYKEASLSLPLSPTAASIAMIEILVTAFDYITNNVHLATISSPHILSKLVNVARNKNLEEGVSVAAILVRCMRLNGNCRKFLSQVTPVDPFLHLLKSRELRAKYAALEYFHEILRMPRSSAIVLLHQIRQRGNINIMHTLMACIQQAQLEHRLLAANLLLQLDMLEDSLGKSVFKEEAMEVLLEAISSEETPSTHILSGCILSNLGGTYAWTGEPYTAAWLVKKAGLTSKYYRHMIKNVDWRDPCLQEAEMDAWSSKTAKGVINFGSSVFKALATGVQSKTRSVSRDCLIASAWLGSEMAIMGPNNLRNSACELLLGGVANFLHPGWELDERLLACQCVYNYACGKGMQKVVKFSEGLRESFRRLSGITWMAEELLRVADYFLTTKPQRVSCVHSQILEAGNHVSGAATALIFYKGQLFAGYSDGTIKIWDIKGQTMKLLLEVREHKKAVTCFTISDAGNNLLSGSADKTIRVWQMVQRKLECVEIIDIKESVKKLESNGDKLFVITQGRGLKVCRASRIVQTFCKNKQVQCLGISQGKIYLGCTDSSIQEVDLLDGQKQEIRPPTNRWRMHYRPINSIIFYKNWVYHGGSVIEGSKFKEWRRRNKPAITIGMGKGSNVLEMAAAEDFIYLNCRSSPSTLQIWLRDQQQKVGRLSAGSKIVSILTGNDIVLCGTESGLIKGWIPL